MHFRGAATVGERRPDGIYRTHEMRVQVPAK
jgi:hypothetical protein